MILKTIGKNIASGIYPGWRDEMRKEDLFKKNHILGVEFDRYLLEYPEVLEQIPENAEIYFLPEDDPDLSRENLKIAESQKAKGRKVVFVKIGKLSPPRSRLQNVRLESMTH
jgi:hypothetical protein